MDIIVPAESPKLIIPIGTRQEMLMKVGRLVQAPLLRKTTLHLVVKPWEQHFLMRSCDILQICKNHSGLISKVSMIHRTRIKVWIMWLYKVRASTKRLESSE